jgi:hypothetical protein
MPTRAEQYRQLARDCLKLANIVPSGPPRDTLIDMAYEWARLADETTPPIFPKQVNQLASNPPPSSSRFSPKDDDKKE